MREHIKNMLDQGTASCRAVFLNRLSSPSLSPTAPARPASAVSPCMICCSAHPSPAGESCCKHPVTNQYYI